MRRFNVRVYGILINDKQEVLLSREYIRGLHLLKFPGGGLEFGEGTKDCLIREFQEETGLAITVGRHLYTTDFFQQSMRHPDEQLLSIYYQVYLAEPTTEGQDFDEDAFLEQCRLRPDEVVEQRRWVPLESLEPAMLTLPIDRHVAAQLAQWL